MNPPQFCKQVKVPKGRRLNQHPPIPPPHTHRQKLLTGHHDPLCPQATLHVLRTLVSALLLSGHDSSKPRGLLTFSHSLHLGCTRLAPGEEPFRIYSLQGGAIFAPHTFSTQDPATAEASPLRSLCPVGDWHGAATNVGWEQPSAAPMLFLLLSSQVMSTLQAPLFICKIKIKPPCGVTVDRCVGRP